MPVFPDFRAPENFAYSPNSAQIAGNGAATVIGSKRIGWRKVRLRACRAIAEEARSEKVSEGSEGARQVLLHYRCLQPCPGGTLVEFRPETGRMHQIRVQAAARAFPIRGDVLYGSRLPFGPPVEIPRERSGRSSR